MMKTYGFDDINMEVNEFDAGFTSEGLFMGEKVPFTLSQFIYENLGLSLLYVGIGGIAFIKFGVPFLTKLFLGTVNNL